MERLKILILVLLLSSNQVWAQHDFVDVVIDLDNTLVRTFNDPEQMPEKFLTPHTDSEGYIYRILDGTPEFLQALSENPKVRISIFSLGDRKRNLALLSELKLPNGKSASEVIYRVLSNEDATLVGGNKFKDLTKVNPDLSQTLIVEDTKDSVLQSQRGHVLWIGNKANAFPHDFRSRLDIEGIKSQDLVEHFTQYRNRLAYAFGSIKKVIDDIGNPRVSIETSLENLQWVKNSGGQRVFKESIAPDLHLQREGVREFHRVNPQYHYTSALPGKTPFGCISEVLKVF